MSSTVERIKEKLGIVEVVGAYVKLNKAGRNFKGLSPFTSEKTPSFFVSPDKNLYYCFSSNKGGDIIDFIQEMEGVDFKEALSMLADRAGVPLEDYNPEEVSERDKARRVLNEALSFFREKLTTNPVALKYLEERGINKETIDKFEVGYAPDSWDSLYKAMLLKKISPQDMKSSGLFVEGNKGLYDRFRGRVMFPFYDYSGRVIGFTGRILPEFAEKTDQGKYINSPETVLFKKSNAIYGISLAKESMRQSNECVLVEGQTDVMLSSQAGVENVVAVSGTAFTEEHIKIIKRLVETLVIVLDADRAGFKATSRAVKMALLNEMDVKVVELPAGSDPADIALKDSAKWKHLISNARDFSDYATNIIEKRVPDKKERESMIREYLYPYIEATENSIRKDQTIQKAAKILNVSPESLREDFYKWLQKEDIGSVRPNTKREAEVKNIIEKKDSIANRMLGVILWQKDSNLKIEGLDEIEREFSEILLKEFPKLHRILDGKELGEAEEKYKNALVFRAETYYNHSDNLNSISKELKALLVSLKREFIKNKIEDVMNRLKEAESLGDTNLIDSLLKELQTLNIDLNK